MLRKEIVNGAVAGFIATGPMTAAMIWLFRFLPWHEREDLPPRQLTEEILEETGTAENPGETPLTLLTLGGHFGYGASCGIAFALVRKLIPLPAPLSGILFGLVVWVVSYAGWIPAAQLLPPATEQPRRRNALMIVAHVVWGAAAGSVLDQLERGSRDAGFGHRLSDRARPRTS